MPVTDPPTRRIPGLFNLRDLGGYPTADGRRIRHGRLFRADGVHRVPPAHHGTLRRLGLDTVLDLRTSHERDAEGSFDGRAHGIRTEHHPVLTQVWDIAELTGGTERGFLRTRYVKMLTERGEVLGAVVRRIATHADDATASGLLFHCSAGKDRTGVVAALVLLALGVPEHVVLYDYARSEEAMTALVAWYKDRERPATANASGFGPAERAAAMALMTAAPAILEGALATVTRRHGSVAGYLDAIGVDHATVQRLRASYLESSVPEPRATAVPA